MTPEETRYMDQRIAELREALADANEKCRSAYHIATAYVAAARTTDETNWRAFRDRLKESLDLQKTALSATAGKEMLGRVRKAEEAKGRLVDALGREEAGARELRERAERAEREIETTIHSARRIVFEDVLSALPEPFHATTAYGEGWNSALRKTKEAIEKLKGGGV